MGLFLGALSKWSKLRDQCGPDRIDMEEYSVWAEVKAQWKPFRALIDRFYALH